MFVIIHGRKPHTSRDLLDYVAHIVYGLPLIRVVESGDHFVALCDYGASADLAEHTFNRMGSFSFGAQYIGEREVAIREFGAWAWQYAPELDTAGCASV